ncbi:hypothetical protein VTL71DRAFT_12739 [Oculimacula yallundae]|uniref:Uncharacterized protein n=1 Tax=Oculimacula yallundae TaxID=86028 RepID=A0ABR4CNW5_9HELO
MRTSDIEHFSRKQVTAMLAQHAESLGNLWSHVAVDCQQQEEAVSCGVIALHHAECVTQGYNPVGVTVDYVLLRKQYSLMVSKLHPEHKVLLDGLIDAYVRKHRPSPHLSPAEDAKTPLKLDGALPDEPSGKPDALRIAPLKRKSNPKKAEPVPRPTKKAKSHLENLKSDREASPFKDRKGKVPSGVITITICTQFPAQLITKMSWTWSTFLFKSRSSFHKTPISMNARFMTEQLDSDDHGLYMYSSLDNPRNDTPYFVNDSMGSQNGLSAANNSFTSPSSAQPSHPRKYTSEFKSLGDTAPTTQHTK